MSDLNSKSEREFCNPNSDIKRMTSSSIFHDTQGQFINNPQNGPNLEETKQPVLPANSHFVPPQRAVENSNSNLESSESDSSVSKASENKLFLPLSSPDQEKELNFYRKKEVKKNTIFGTVNPINPSPGQITVEIKSEPVKEETKSVKIKVESTVNKRDEKTSVNESRNNMSIKDLSKVTNANNNSFIPLAEGTVYANENSGLAKDIGKENKPNTDERTPLNPNLIDSTYRNEFINNFETFQYRKKTFAEKFCCKKLFNLDKLKRLKDSDIKNDKSKLFAFILSKNSTVSQGRMENHSIVDLYMVCSLFEIDSIVQKLMNLTDVFETISKINHKIIETFNNRKRYLGNIDNSAERFFDKSRNFIYENLRDNNFTDYTQFPAVPNN